MKQVYGVWFPDDDTHFEKVMKSDGSYQKDTFDMAMRYVKNPKIFYDIGAHVGLWSLQADKAGFKHIIAYEPNPKVFNCLSVNLENISCMRFLYPHGISQLHKNLDIIEEKHGNSGAVTVTENKDSDIYSLSINNHELHHYIEYFQIKSHECLVKIDTEGMEAECILGMDKILYALRPVVCVEQKSNKDALDILQKMGMEIVKQVRRDYILTWKNQ